MSCRDKHPGLYEIKTCPACGEECLIGKKNTYCSLRCSNSVRAWGATSSRWKGDSAGYIALHSRLHRRRGKAKDYACGCGKPALDWANLTGRYEDIDDYEAMCRSCHMLYDNERRRNECA